MAELPEIPQSKPPKPLRDTQTFKKALTQARFVEKHKDHVKNAESYRGYKALQGNEVPGTEVKKPIITAEIEYQVTVHFRTFQNALILIVRYLLGCH